MRKFSHFLGVFFSIMTFSTAYADETFTLNLITPSGSSKPIGTVSVSDSKHGLLLTPHLVNLPPGLHGFHIHEKPDCANGGMAAGGHLDPSKTNHHLGPYNDAGHLGDLPVLYVDKDGRSSTNPILAPRLKLADIKDRAIMIHAGGDNYSDTPAMGGGGSRLACGVTAAHA